MACLPMHRNEFMLLNGVPYLVGEYLDEHRMDSIDPRSIDNRVSVFSDNPRRVVVDIQVSDIDHQPDGSLAVIGNKSKTENMLEILKTRWKRTETQMRVIKKGIIARIHYQFENERNCTVIRSMHEDIYIKDRNYFVSINPDNINDNAIITNFIDFHPVLVTQFTHSRDPMILRVTDIELLYESVEPDPYYPRKPIYKHPGPTYPSPPVQYFYDPENEVYYYHEMQQRFHDLNDWRLDPQVVTPESLLIMNRFYHFDEDNRCFMLHMDEIDNPRCNSRPLACGKIRVQKTYRVLPGMSILFKMSIWKNDVILVSDGTLIADALQIPRYQKEYADVNNLCPFNQQINPPHYKPHPPKIPTVAPFDYAQNKVINQISTAVMDMNTKLQEFIATQTNSSNEDDGEGNEENGEDGSTPLNIPKLPENSLDFLNATLSSNNGENNSYAIRELTPEEIRDIVYGIPTPLNG